MITMSRLERFHFLSYFGSGLAIPYFQAIQIGTLYISNPTTQVRYDIRITKRNKGQAYYQWEFERMFNKALADGLIKRVENARIKAMKLEEFFLIEKEDYDYQITEKGDACLRAEQIQRDGDYSFYKNFDRTLDGAAKINPGLFKQN